MSQSRPDNLFSKLFSKIFPRPPYVPSDSIRADVDKMAPKDKEIFRRLGLTLSSLTSQVSDSIAVNFERYSLYAEANRAHSHPIVSGALKLYATTAVRRSAINNASIWVTSENSVIQNTLNDMIANLGIENRLYSWAYNVALLGDMFPRVIGMQGRGVLSLNDDPHPINISRIDYEGNLIGFFETPMGSLTATSNQMLPPWAYIHLRLPGAAKRYVYDDHFNSSGYRSLSLLSVDTRRAGVTYGHSLVCDALPTFKRLRLAEDTLLMARVSKSVLRYLYKVSVNGNNNEAIGDIIDAYAQDLKRMRSVDVREESEYFKDSHSTMTYLEDVIVPVWGDTNNLSLEKIGGETDIRYIVDVEDLRNQLAMSLAVPLQMLGYMKDLPAFTGGSSLEQVDRRFAQNASNLRLALVEGITRLCQIHLAYLGKSPDINQFQVHMVESSTAEEAEIKESLDKGIDVCIKFADMVGKYFPSIDSEGMFYYLNEKILKLSDFDPRKLTGSVREDIAEAKKASKVRPVLINPDIRASLPCIGKKELWESAYGNSVATKVAGEEGLINVELKGV